MNNPHSLRLIYIYSGICALIVVAAIIGIIYPSFTKIVSLKNEIYDQRIQLAVYEQQRSNAAETRKDYNKIKNDTNNISKIFISKDQILNFISSLENIATNHSLKQTISIDTTTVQDNSSKNTELTISTDGAWEQQLAYLADLERLDYYVSINDLAITKTNGNLSMSLSAKIFNP
jgi:Tfp pilus assembly protein PilO